MRDGQRSSKGVRWALLAGALSCGCALAPAPSSYQVRLPLLTAPTIRVPCQADGRPATCRVILETDYEALVRELKAACVAAGGSDVDCQTELAAEETL